MRVLVVEDDRRLARALGVGLARLGYEVAYAATGAAARTAKDYDVMLLDLCLPDEDGLEVCRHVREYSNVAIIMLTARGEEHDCIVGLRSGADDYVSKPFSMGELGARIQAVLRRSHGGQPGRLTCGGLEVDLEAREVRYENRLVALTPKEFALLARLARNHGAIVSRECLLREIWKDSSTSASRTLDVHITTLRAKLGKPGPVETVRGVGYRLSTDGKLA